MPTRVLFEHEDLVFTHQVASDMSRETRLRTSAGAWLWQTSSKRGAQFAAEDALIPRFMVVQGLMEHTKAKPVGDSPKLTPDDIRRLRRLFLQFDRFFPRQRPFASAPVRSKPRRTYDPARPSRDPEGETIPMYLSTAFFEDKKSWKALKEALERFGREAGLFDEIAVKPLGKRGSEPFQMHVRRFGGRAKGPLRNPDRRWLRR